MPYGDENDPLENTNPPGYIAPNFDEIYTALWDLMGGSGGIQDLVGGAMDVAPPNVAQYIPWSSGQIGDWLTKRMSGKRAKDVAGRYKTGQESRLNRFAKGELARRKTGSAETGGRGSSAEARMLAESKGQYFDALDQIDLNAIGMEETIRGQDFATGMQGAGALEAILRGDYQDALNQGLLTLQGANTLLSSQGQDADILGQISGLEGSEAGMENLFNQWLYQMLQQGGVGADNLGNYADLILQWGQGL